jgi:hypothetical protein
VDLVAQAHDAIELEDLPRLRAVLDQGAPVNAVDERGMCMLCHAVDVEIDAHAQTGEPLHVDVTAYLFARGADPEAECSTGSAARMARSREHWLAIAIFSGIG